MNRVVSLLPSATELLCAIEGGAGTLVGRSHECDFPAEVRDRPVLTTQRTVATSSAAIDAEVRESLARSGSLYELDAEALVALRPDVILTQDLCDVCSIDVETVRAVAAELAPAPQVVSLDPKRIEDVFDDVLTVGAAVGLERAAHDAMVRMREGFWSAIDYVNAFVDGPEVAFLEWMDPLFAGGHWTPQLIERAGARHSLNPAGERSRTITPDELVAAQPDALIVCPCGYDLDSIRNEMDTLTSQSWWRAIPAVVDGRVALVDGSQMFNRPGPRLVEAFRWLVGWLNDRPQLIPKSFPWQRVS